MNTVQILKWNEPLLLWCFMQSSAPYPAVDPLDLACIQIDSIFLRWGFLFCDSTYGKHFWLPFSVTLDNKLCYCMQECVDCITGCWGRLQELVQKRGGIKERKGETGRDRERIISKGGTDLWNWSIFSPRLWRRLEFVWWLWWMFESLVTIA